MAYAAHFISEVTYKELHIPRNQRADILHRTLGEYNREKRFSGILAGDAGALLEFAWEA